jgi:hypothetical protein
MLEGVRQELHDLQRQNAYLREVVMNNITPREIAVEILNTVESPPVDIFLRSSILLDNEDECISEEDNGGKPIEKNITSTTKNICGKKNMKCRLKPTKDKKEESKIRKDTFEQRIIYNENILGLADAMSGNYAF